MDVSEGSPVDRQVVGPLLDRLGVDPFSTDIRSFLIEHLRIAMPEVDTTSAGGQFRALVLGTFEALLTPLRAEIAQMRAAKSMQDPSRLTAVEMDALLANVIGQRQEGTRARVNVRVYFGERRAVQITGSVSARTRSGLKFYATTSLYVASDTLGQYTENGKYYLDIEMEAAEEGEAYNIGAGEITEVSGIPGALSAVNKSGVFTVGSSAETNTGALTRLRTTIGERSPNTEAGISSLAYDRYPDVRDVRVIGYGDPEMTRDIIRGTVSLTEGALGYGAIVDTVTDCAGAAVDLSASDSTGPALSYLTLPVHGTAYFKTFRVLSPSSDFADAEVGQSLQLGSYDRRITDTISDGEVWIDDFEVIAKGNSGYTVQHRLTDGPALLYALKLQDTARDWLHSGIAVGDWLRVRGTWTMSGQPSAGNLSNGPGNTGKSYFQVQAVEADGVQVSSYLPNEYNRQSGDNAMTLEDAVGVFTVGQALTAPFSGDTGVILSASAIYYSEATLKYYVDLTLSGVTGGFSPGESITTATGSGTLYYLAIDRAYTTGNTVNLASDTSSVFTVAPAPQSGDWITLCRDDGSGFAAEEFQITGTPTAYSLTVVGTPTACATYDVKWAIRRGNTNGGPADRSGFLLGGTSSVEWAVLRYSAQVNALADTESYDWFQSTESAVTAQVRGAVTLADVAGSLALTISDVPMGITLPQRLGQSIDVASSDEVHIGGCTDIHLHQLTCPTHQLDLLIEPVDPLASGTDLVCAGNTAVVSAASLAGVDTSQCVLVIEEGESAGSYRVLLSAGGTAVLDAELTSAFTGTRYYVTRDLTMSFTTPKRVLLESSSTLSTVHQSDLLVDNNVDFVDLGILVNDIIELTSGQDDGLHVITEVVDNHTLRVANNLTVSGDGIYYTLYRPKGGPVRPFRRITGVELLSADGASTGITVPPRDPLAARAMDIGGSGGERTFTRATFQVYGYVSGSAFGIQDLSEASATSDLRHRVAGGDVCVIESGDNAGSYLVYYVDGNIIWLMGHLPVADSFDSPVIEFTFDGGTGTFAVGNTVKVGATSFGTISYINYTTPSVAGTMRVVMSAGGTAPAENAGISTTASAATCNVDVRVATITATLGPAAQGTARVYMQEPTVLELRNRGAQSSDTALLTSADLRQYVVDPSTHHTYLDARDTSLGRYLVGTLRVVSLSSVVGTFVVGERLRRTTAAAGILGTIVYVSESGTEIWIEYESPQATLAAAIAVRSEETPATTAVVDSVTSRTDMLVLDQSIFDLGVESGDLVEVIGSPLVGTVNLATGANVSGMAFTLTVGDGAEQTITFSGTNPVPVDQLSPRGLKQQINAASVGVTATIKTVGAAKYLVLHAEEPMVIGSSACNTLLGFTTGQNSESAAYGHWLRVTSFYGYNGLGLGGLYAAAASLSFESDVKLKLRRPGTQRFAPSDFTAENGVYYVDARVRSLKTGDTFNVARDEALVVSGHRSYGYRLVSLNDALTYSTIEDTDIEFSALLLDAELEDLPENLTTLGSKSVRVTYEAGDAALAAQSLYILPRHRVVNNNPVTKVMQPGFVGMTVRYSGGSRPAVILADIVDAINETPSSSSFEMATVYGALSRRGASRIDGPLEAFVVRHKEDRSVDGVWSMDAIDVGRTVRLVADTSNITVERQ